MFEASCERRSTNGPRNDSLITYVGRSWTMNEHDPDWARQIISDAITNLRFLRNLKLILPRSVYVLTMNGLHFDRLCHLEKISVSGSCSGYHSLIVSEVAEAIGNNPLLAHLEINYPWGDFPPLDNFLAKRSPETHPSFSHVAIADVRYYFGMMPQMYALRSLELTNTASYICSMTRFIESRTLMSEIYKALAHERILLSRIIIDDVFPAFLDYLSSYSGF